MKKLLSLILAITMILSLIPSAFAAETPDITIKYDICGILKTGLAGSWNFGLITKELTKDFFRINSDTTPTATSNQTIRIRNGRTSSDGLNNGFELLRKDVYVSLDVYVPIAGTYTMTGVHPTWTGGGTVEVYVNDASSPAGNYDCSHLENSSDQKDDYRPYFTFKDVEFKAGWNKIKFVAVTEGQGRVKTFSLILGNGGGDALMPYLNGNTTLEVGETATLKGYLSSTSADATVTYTTSNDCVTVGTDGTITAVKPGKATITMTASNSTVVAGNPYTVDITVPNAKTDFVSIGIDDDGDGVATITNAELGEKVIAVAKVPEGKVFRGWVRGSADNGHLVWDKEEYEFVATTHTYLTAIYTDANPAATDEYYHWNGQFLGNDKTTAEANISPIVGYTFANSWTEAKKENTITSWIAKFNKENDEYTVTAGNNGFDITKADDNYDTEVTCTSDNAVYWYRDGKLVDYGTEYKFFIWDNTTVTTSNEGHNGAKLMLDKVKGKSYMVEYDAGNATLLEVGILFGDTGDTPTVESCKEKMSSQRENFTHGQFSATSNYAVARGYLIYKDGDSYRVIYAD